MNHSRRIAWSGWILPAVLMFCAGSARIAGATEAWEQWRWRNPFPSANDLNSVAYGDGQYIAVGDCGTILTSPDGTNWTVQASGTTNHLRGAAWGGGQFAVVGDRGTVLTSADATRWRLCDSAAYDPLAAVAYGNGRFVAVGGQESGLVTNTIVTSLDGVTWSRSDSGSTYGLTGVAFGNGEFVAVRYHASSSSTDGITWAQHPMTEFPNRLVFADGKFVAAGAGSMLVSQDGRTWDWGSPPTAHYMRDVSHGHGNFVGVGWSGAVLSSADGVQWTPRDSGTHECLEGVVFGNGLFVAVGWGGTILTSADGITWAAQIRGPTAGLWSVTHGKGQYVAVGDRGTVLASPDTVDWVARATTTTNTLAAVLFAQDQFVAAGQGGTILTSADGSTWTPRASGVTNTLRALASNGSRLVAVGGDAHFSDLGILYRQGAILTSVDGLSWARLPAAEASECVGIAFGNGRFVVLAEGGNNLTWGQVFVSTNGLDWADCEFPSGSPGAIAFGNGGFVASGYGKLYTSPDGAEWTLCFPSPAEAVGAPAFNLSGIGYGNGLFAAISWDGTRLTSLDGLHWSPRWSGTVVGLNGICYFDGRFTAVGEHGAILQSGPLVRVGWAAIGSEGGLQFTVAGPAGQACTVQGSGDLTRWEPLAELVLTNGAGGFHDALPAGECQRSYRVLSR